MKYKENRHHLLWSRANWSQNKELKSLRENPDHIISMPVEDHAELHRNISYTPAVSIHIARRALKHLSDMKRPNTPQDSISRLQEALERSCDDERVDLVEYQVAQIAMQALELQREYMPVPLAQVYDLGYYR